MPDNWDNPFWQYAIRCYARPEVKSTTLRLQEELSSDVCLILLCGWLAASNQAFQSDKLPDSIDNWRREVVVPIRKLRKLIDKSDESKAKVRAALLDAELAAERSQIAELYECFAREDDQNKIVMTDAEKAALCYQNLLDYLGSRSQSQEVNCLNLKQLSDLLITSVQG